MDHLDVFRKKIQEKKEKGLSQPKYGTRKLSIGLVSCLLGFMMFITAPVSSSAAGIQARSMDNQVHYTLAGETDGVLDYARTDFSKEDRDGIHLTVTKWAKLPGSWGDTNKGPYNGRYLLNFFEDRFFTQIDSITVNGVEFEKEANGALWKVPINIQTFKSGTIGAITNTDVVIKLKNGATLSSLGLNSTKIDFTTTWVRGDGKADKGGYDNGFILKNNPNHPTEPSNSKAGDGNYLGTGLNGLGSDGTQSKDGNFSGGHAGKAVSFDAKNKAIKSTVSFKPDQNFLQANSGWVLYINEVIPKELFKYIDTNNVTLGMSTSTGTITATKPIKLTVDPNGNGHISTKDTPELSIVGGDWNKVTQVRNTLDSQVFYGALGQRRSYTIEYKLKSNVTNQEFADALNKYIKENNSQMNFESWLTADFVDSSGAFPNIRKPDSGKPNKRVQNTYSTATLEVLDTDKDGLYDFVEDEIGSDKFNVDTDGDGVPDGQEYLVDKTKPIDPKSYLVVKPNVTTKNIEANQNQTIVGTVPKTIYKNPANNTQDLQATNGNAGNVIVKAYKYVADDTDYTNQPVKAQTTIPFSDLTAGNFTVNIPSGTFAEGDKVILVAYSPDGKNPMVSSTTVKVGATKVTFDTNGGQWSDGTNADKVVNAVNGTATQPEEPTRDGYQFLGWASTANATAAEAGILNNIEDAKEVFAVWKDVKAPVIANIGDQTVVEGKSLTEIPVTTDDPDATIAVKDLPTGVTYTNGKISGTPKVDNWGPNEEKREFTVTVEAKDPSGNTSTKTFKITVQRDTDKDGNPDITDLDDDGDGYSDADEKAKGSDPKNAGSIPATFIGPVESMSIENQEQTVVDKKPIKKVNINPDNIDSNAEIDRTKVPSGLIVDDSVPGVVSITGSPNITDWGPDEETRKFEIPVTVTNSDGSKVTKKVIITVQRDTDGDGDPDVTDPDDDGDGYTDVEENAKGSNPKDPNSRPAAVITPVSPTTVTNPNQTVIDEKPITNIVITPGNPAANVTVDNSKLPNGVTYNPTTNTVSGTPDVTDWGPSEETRKFEVPVVVTNPDGSKVTKDIEIVVQRDTDKDGDPDVTDPDDDGDGYTDAQEKTKGTDPKNSNSKPSTPATPTNPSNPNRPGTGNKPDTGRIAGKDRIDTAIDISKKFFGKSKTVIVVRSDLFPDSMTASVLAKLLNAPILLNPTDKLDSRVAEEIKRLGATEIIIVGGTDSISDRVREELKAFDADKDVERIAGKDRYGTSEMVARRVIGITGKKNTAVVASGQVFPDALSVGTFASRDGYPILLVKKDLIPNQIQRVIKDLDIDKVYIAGGTDTISKAAEAKLPKVIERMAGKNRYETSVAIAKSKFQGSKEAFVASGQQFADALVISPISGKYNLPTLLVSTNVNSNREVKRYIQETKIGKLTAIGGERYVPSSIIDSLTK